MEDKEILLGVADTITEKPVLDFEVTVKQRSFWDKLFRRNKVRRFIIRPAVVGTMYRISAKAVQLHEELTKAIIIEGGRATADMGATMQLINLHLEDIVYIIGAAIQNDRHEPNPKLLDFIRDNFDAADFFEVLLPVLGNLNLQAFLNSIVLVKGSQGVLRPKTSPKDHEEMIARGA